MPVGEEPGDGVLERLGQRHFVRLEVGIPAIARRMLRIVGGQRRRRNVVAAPPDLHLRFAVLCRGLRLVEALQRTVVTLVQSPRPALRNPHHVHLGQRDPQRADRALEQRRVRDVEFESLGLQQPAGLDRLLATALAQIDIGPTGESILFVPGAFAVPQQYQPKHETSYGGLRPPLMFLEAA